MLHTLRVQIELDRRTGVPEDVVMNTLHFVWDDDEPGYEEVDDLGTVLHAPINTFYTAIDGYLSELLSPTSNRIKIFDLADPEPRTPIDVYTNSMFLSGLSTSVAPAELAICLSFMANNPPGTEARRYRNRIYLGPVAQTTFLEGVGDVVVDPAATAGIANAAGTMLATNSAGLSWVIFSPTDDTYRGIDGGWVDNGFDIQRRRGSDATLRSVF